MGFVQPILVIRDKSFRFWWLRPKRYICVDGQQRLVAARILERETIEAFEIEATVENALINLNSVRREAD